MKKIIFGITSLTLGGAERVLVDLANKLCDKFDITVFTIYANGEFEKSLSPKVKLKSIYSFSFQDLSTFEKKVKLPLKLLLRKKSIYKKFIKKDYDVEVAFLEGPITRLFSCKNKNTRKIAWVHNDISCVFGKGIKAKLKKKIDKNIYSKYETLVFVSKDNRDNFEKVYPELRNNELERVHKRVIYNYIDKENVLKKAEEDANIKFDNENVNIVSVCRLVEQKAVERLIDIHTKLISDNYFHKIFIVGDGPLKETLKEKIEQKGVQDSFILLGKKENPYPYIKQADYFALLSYFEGYPMVVEEAKILDKNILITNTAAREVVRDYDKAIIFENSEDAIYEGLKKILKNKNNKKKVNTQTPYNNEKVLNKVIKLLDEEI